MAEPSAVVGLGRADVDQAIEQRLVALGRVEPGLDLLPQGQRAGAVVFGSPAGVGLLDGGQRDLATRRIVLGLRDGPGRGACVT